MFDFGKKRREKKEKERRAQEEHNRIVAQAEKDIEELKALNKYLDDLIAKRKCRPTLENIEKTFELQEEIDQLLKGEAK